MRPWVRRTRRGLGIVLAVGLCAASGRGLAQNPPPASAPASAPASWVIPGAAAPSVYGLLPPIGAPLRPTTFATDSVNIRQGDVEACFTSPAGLQCVMLLHPSQARPGDQQTRYFAVRAPAGTDPALVAAALASIRQGERESPWLAVTSPRAATSSPRGTRRSPIVIGGVILLLIAIWLGVKRRGTAARGAAAGVPAAKPDEPPAKPGA